MNKKRKHQINKHFKIDKQKKNWLLASLALWGGFAATTKVNASADIVAPDQSVEQVQSADIVESTIPDNTYHNGDESNPIANPMDVDGDGIPNSQDPDVDGDGIPNSQDPDVDGDGIPNSMDSTPYGQGTNSVPGIDDSNSDSDSNSSSESTSNSDSNSDSDSNSSSESTSNSDSNSQNSTTLPKNVAKVSRNSKTPPKNITLPHTGESDQGVLSLAGVALLATMTFGLTSKRRRREYE